LVDAGKVQVPHALRGTGLNAGALLSGRPVRANKLEPRVAACMRRQMLAGADGDTLLALEELLRLLIARAPGQDVLVCEAGEGETEGPPNVLNWLLPVRDQYPNWPEARKMRANLLLQLQQALDTQSDEPGRDETLLVCLELLPAYPDG